jgi:hypothetical protein
MRAGADDDGDGHGRHRGRGDCTESEASRGAAGPWRSLRLEALPQPVRSFDFGFGTTEQRDGPLLLGESLGKNRRSVDASLDVCAPLGRKRTIRKRRKLRDPASVGLFFAPPSHPHGVLHGTAVRDCV